MLQRKKKKMMDSKRRKVAAQTEEKSDKMKFEKAAEIDTFGSEKFTRDLAVQSMNLKERSDSSDLIAANLQEPITSASYEVLMDQWLPAISHRDITEVQQLGEDGVLNKVLVARRFHSGTTSFFGLF